MRIMVKWVRIAPGQWNLQTDFGKDPWCHDPITIARVEFRENGAPPNRRWEWSTGGSTGYAETEWDAQVVVQMRVKFTCHKEWEDYAKGLNLYAHHIGEGKTA
tara:strand:- start:67858 stop:68166 length:309 start_codon:yes stop_codon:yes gene_type:complete